jgi:hypothetical protein
MLVETKLRTFYTKYIKYPDADTGHDTGTDASTPIKTREESFTKVVSKSKQKNMLEF